MPKLLASEIPSIMQALDARRGYGGVAELISAIRAGSIRLSPTLHALMISPAAAHPAVLSVSGAILQAAAAGQPIDSGLRASLKNRIARYAPFEMLAAGATGWE